MAGEVVLETARLVFRVWTDEDLSLAMRLWGDSDVMSLLGGPMPEEAVRGRLAQEQVNWREHGVQYWPMFLRSGGELAGCAGLTPWSDRPGCLMAGVHLHRAVWGRRLGEEAAAAVVRYGFGLVGTTEIVAGHHPENGASRRLILALGFMYDGDRLWPPTGLMHPLYRLRREETEFAEDFGLE